MHAHQQKDNQENAIYAFDRGLAFQVAQKINDQSDNSSEKIIPAVGEPAQYEL